MSHAIFPAMNDVLERLRRATGSRYTLAEQIGEGGMATVYRARDPRHKRDVAIKVLKTDVAESIGPERFLHEIEIAARLQHPHIVPVYDSGEAEGVLYYVMPFVEGESLRERLLRGPLAPAEAIRVTREVASALDYAHRQGVIHRDIKPANILLSQGHAVVADFGIARVARTHSDGIEPGLTQFGATVGTPWYMSPEQATAETHIDGRTDVYALGCVLFEMLEGHPPYDGNTAQAVVARAISAPIPELRTGRGVSTTVARAVRQALAKDPVDRFATAGDFADALDMSTAEHLGASGSRRRRIGVIAAALTAVAIGIGAGVALRGRVPGTIATGADVIAVLPFEVAGTRPELGEGMVSLLSTNLNAVGPLRTVDARTVLQRWRTRGGEQTGLDLEQSLEVGRDVGAGSVLLGSVVEAGSEIRLAAELYTIEGRELATVQIDGNADQSLQLVDSLSVAILRAIWRSKEPLPSFDVAAITSGSLDAIRDYMRGQTFFRHGQWDSAQVAFQNAVELDSAFALAHLALSEAYGWTGQHGSAMQTEAVERAHQFEGRLPPRERLLVIAYTLDRRGDARSLDSIRRYTERYPADPRGWYALGDFQHHNLGSLLLSPEEQLAPFDRSIALDSTFAAAIVHPMEITLQEGQVDAFARYLRANQAAGASDRSLPLARTVVWGEEADARRALDSLLGSNQSTLQIALGAAVEHRPERVEMILEGLRGRTQPENGNAALGARYAEALTSFATGRLARADRVIVELEAVDTPEAQALAGLLRLLGVVNGLREPTYASEVPVTLGRAQGETAERLARAMIEVADGNVTDGLTAIRATVPDTPALATLLRGLTGWAELQAGDTVQAVLDLRYAWDSLPPTPSGEGQLYNAVRLQLAKALAARPDTRAEGIRLLRYGFPTLSAFTLRAATLLEMAHALERAGDRRGALDAYDRFVRIWQYADPQLQPRVEAARQAIERLTRELG